MAMIEPADSVSADRLVEVLKEIRDELRAVRTELGARDSGLATSSIRTELVDRGARWRNAALAAGGMAGLALVLGFVMMRDRPAPEAARPTVAVAPSVAAMPSMPMPAVTPAQAPVVGAAPVAARAAMPVATSVKAAAGSATPAPKAGARLPAGAPAPATLASMPASTKKRVKPDVAANPPAEVASEDDETMAFSPPPRRARVHRLSYGPVGSEPAKL
jgi:hypothetical protein